MTINQEYLNSCLNYDAETGVLTWLKDRPESHFDYTCGYAMWVKDHAGKRAGCINGHGYLHIGIKGKRYKAHRLIWMMVHNEWPDQIDHINGNKLDNRLCNLRNVDAANNLRNTAIRKDNKSGVVGVNFHKTSGKWVSYIRVNGKHKHLGTFEDKSQAIEERKKAEKLYGFHENHGRKAAVLAKGGE